MPVDESMFDTIERRASRVVARSRAELRGLEIDPSAVGEDHTENLNLLLTRAATMAERGAVDDARALANIVGTIARAARATTATERMRAQALQESESSRALAPREMVRFDHGPIEKFRDQATIEVSVSGAKASLSRLITNALNGDVVIIMRGNHPVARLVPYERAVPMEIDCEPAALETPPLAPMREPR